MSKRARSENSVGSLDIDENKEEMQDVYLEPTIINDFVFVVDSTIFHVHRFPLVTNCQYFYTLLSEQPDLNKVVLPIDFNFNANDVQTFLECIYGQYDSDFKLMLDAEDSRDKILILKDVGGTMLLRDKREYKITSIDSHGGIHLEGADRKDSHQIWNALFSTPRMRKEGKKDIDLEELLQIANYFHAESLMEKLAEVLMCFINFVAKGTLALSILHACETVPFSKSLRHEAIDDVALFIKEVMNDEEDRKALEQLRSNTLAEIMEEIVHHYVR